MEPRRIGTPTHANSKKANAPAPTESDASDTMMLTGLPVRTSSDPALPANAMGMSMRDAGRAVRRAIMTTIGRRAATAPLRLMSAVSPAQRPITETSNRSELSPASDTRRPPAQAVRPVRSIPSLTTNRVAMNTTTGSPNPAVASSRAGIMGTRRISQFLVPVSGSPRMTISPRVKSQSRPKIRLASFKRGPQ